MNGLRETVDAVASELSLSEDRRNTAIAESRKIIRLSKNVIHAIHVGQPYVEEEREMASRMQSLIKDVTSDILYNGPAADAMMEYAEAELLSDVVENREIRSFSDLGITPQSWIMGLADAVGEIRRVIVTKLMNSDIAGARALFASMAEICEELLLLDVPDAVLPIRRKQDVARSLVDKTRSDLLNAIMSGKE